MNVTLDWTVGLETKSIYGLETRRLLASEDVSEAPY